MKRLAVIPLVLLSQSVLAAEDYCQNLNIAAADTNWHRPYIGSVIGKERLYFHSAPDSKCKENKLFVIPGDSVAIYSNYGEFSQIGFSSKDHDYLTWVLTSHLKVIAKPDEPFVP